MGQTIIFFLFHECVLMTLALGLASVVLIHTAREVVYHSNFHEINHLTAVRIPRNYAEFDSTCEQKRTN